jgi:hypothetical protein
VRELEKPIGRVFRRMRFQRFLSALVWCLCATLAVVAVTLLVEKLTSRSLPGPDWVPFAVAGGLAVAIASVVAAVGGPSRVDAAVAIDHAFNLNERLSSALTLPPEWTESPAGRAVIADAIKHIADIDVRHEFGPRIPKLAWIPLIPAALAVGMLFIGDLKQLQAQAKSSEVKIDKKALVEQTKTLGKKIASQRKDMEKTKFPETDKLLAQIEKAADELSKAPPAEKDKALVEMNKLSDALKDRQKQLGSPEQINRQLQQLKDSASQGPADQFAKDLAKGDFQKAAEQLKKLTEQLKSGKMTEKDKQALKEQLGEMAKQLKELANLEQRKAQLEEARKNGALSQKQYEQEMAKLEEQSKSLQKLSQMAQKLGQAQEALQKGDTQKAAEALGMTKDQLEQMAKNLQELESLDSALADLQDAKNGMTGDGMNQLGEALDGLGQMGQRRQNNGSGLGRGRGQGDRPEAPDNTAEYTTKVKQQLGKGKAVATGTAPSNSPLKGNSVIDIQGEIETASGNAADALSNQKIPRNIEKHIRGYFDQINKGK